MRLKDEKFYKTVRDFLDIYLIKHRGYSLNTQKSYREAINLLLLYFKTELGLEYASIGFEDITYSNITGFLEWLSKSRGCSPATVNLRLMAIRSFTKYAGILDSGKIYIQKNMRCKLLAAYFAWQMNIRSTLFWIGRSGRPMC